MDAQQLYLCTGTEPTLMNLLAFPTERGPINIAQEIAGGDYKTFGIFLLEDSTVQSWFLFKCALLQMHPTGGKYDVLAASLASIWRLCHTGGKYDALAVLY